MSYHSTADRQAPITSRPLRKPQDTPLTGSIPVWCQTCGARGLANRALVKRGTHKIPTCINCRGLPAGTNNNQSYLESPTETTKATPVRRNRRPDVPASDICHKPVQKAPAKDSRPPAQPPATCATTGQVKPPAPPATRPTRSPTTDGDTDEL